MARVVAPICSWENGEAVGEGSPFPLSVLWGADSPLLALRRMKALAVLMLGEHFGGSRLGSLLETQITGTPPLFSGGPHPSSKSALNPGTSQS